MQTLCINFQNAIRGGANAVPNGMDLGLLEKMHSKLGENFKLEQQMRDADIILFLNDASNQRESDEEYSILKKLAGDLSSRIFVFGGGEYTKGEFPGLYCCLSKKYFSRARHKSIAFPSTPNPLVNQHQFQSEDGFPSRLATFSGANSHQTREILFKKSRDFGEQGIKITKTLVGQFNVSIHGEELSKYAQYALDILDAKFSLCPAGSGPSSFRIQESMALGRAPVIISDQWVPIDGIIWTNCSIRVPEICVRDLPFILKEFEPRWREMGIAARAEWEEVISPDVYWTQITDALRGLIN